MISSDQSACLGTARAAVPLEEEGSLLVILHCRASMGSVSEWRLAFKRLYEHQVQKGNESSA